MMKPIVFWRTSFRFDTAECNSACAAVTGEKNSSNTSAIQVGNWCWAHGLFVAVLSPDNFHNSFHTASRRAYEDLED